MLKQMQALIGARINMVTARKSALEQELAELNIEQESLNKLFLLYGSKQYDSIESERNVILGYTGIDIREFIPASATFAPDREVAITSVIPEPKHVYSKRAKSKVQERCLEVIDILGERGEITISQLAKETGYPQSQASNIIYRLVDENMVVHSRNDGNKKYFTLVK